jgi:hypothetical protein
VGSSSLNTNPAKIRKAVIIIFSGICLIGKKIVLSVCQKRFNKFENINISRTS